MKYYCIGIKGAGMSTLANILHDLSNEVSGYDDTKEYKFTEEGLKARNIPIFHDGNHELDKDTIVTYSKAFKESHPEIQRVKNLGLKMQDYNLVVGEITKQFDTVGISGTHGKTTTSLLLSHILKNTVGCSYFVGDGTAYANKNDKIFVIESDEYNKHFLAYLPQIAVITNIELDHTECYPGGIEEIKDTFKIFADKAEIVVACGDDQNIRDIDFVKETIFYGFSEDNNVIAKNISLSDEGSHFDCYIDGELFGHFDLPLYGKHMVLNALSAIIVAKNYGVAYEDILANLKTFPGAKRRFKEIIIKDIIIIDDYAHHPTEIDVTIAAARQKYPDREIVAIFLPNTYSRTEALLEDFISSLAKADTTYVMDVYSDREKAEEFPGVDSHLIRDAIPGSKNLSMETVEKLLTHKNAVMCFMSCTNIYDIENAYIELLK